MSFDIFLIPADQSRVDDVDEEVRQAVVSLGGRFVADERVTFVLPDGSQSDCHGTMFAGGLTPAIADVIFNAAKATRCFIAPMGLDAVIRPPGVTEAFPDEDLVVQPAQTAAELLAMIEAGGEPSEG